MQRRVLLLGLVITLSAACGPNEDISAGEDAGGPGDAENEHQDEGTGGGDSSTSADGAGEMLPGEIPDHWKTGLGPGVNLGIAEGYPNDMGIAADPYVLGSEDFETGTVTIPTEDDRYKKNVTVTSTEHYTGRFAGVHTWPKGVEGPTTRFVLGPEAHQDARPAYFMRMYFKYDKSFHPGDQTSDVGVKGFGIYYEDGSDNGTCTGMSWYNVACQFVGWGGSSKPQANNGFLWVGHLYSYNSYPEQAMATVGTIEGKPSAADCRFSSYAQPFDYIKFQSWRSYELGLYLNTAGKNDGEARFWIDGVLQSRTTKMRFRDVEAQLPNKMHLNLYRTTTAFPQTMVRWVDNIVLARRYIGPVHLPH